MVKQKYPTATANQLIQHLIHTTSQEKFGWQSTFGFGIPSIGNMLAKDPAGWPDVNPLLNGPDAARADFPSSVYRDPAAPAPTSAAPTATAPPTSDESAKTAARSTDDSSPAAVPWVVGAVVALGLIAAAIVARRRGRRGGEAG